MSKVKQIQSYIYLALVLVSGTMLCTSCNPEARYEIENVNVEMKIKDISAGYVRVAAETNKDAYYVMGALKKTDEYDPVRKPNQFMMLMLDSLYQDYLNWRYYYLKHGEDYIAPFSSHCLQYNATEVYFKDLKADTDYWLYSFPVNPENNTSTGELNLQEFHTYPISHANLHFDVRVDGYFVLVYPRDSNDNLLDNTPPYYAELLDKERIEEAFGPIVPGTIADVGNALYENYQDFPELYNVSTTIDKWSFEDDSFTPLIENHTYYVLVAVLNGTMVNRTVYRFVWTGPDYKNDNPELYFREGPGCPHDKK